MHYVIDISGNVTAHAEAADLGIDLDKDPRSWFDLSSSVDVSDVTIEGEVKLTGAVRIDRHTVEAYDMPGFDAEQTLGEAVDPYGSVTTEDVEVEVTEYPTGFEEVEEALGDRDEAISVFAALDRAGLSVTN